MLIKPLLKVTEPFVKSKESDDITIEHPLSTCIMSTEPFSTLIEPFLHVNTTLDKPLLAFIEPFLTLKNLISEDNRNFSCIDGTYSDINRAFIHRIFSIIDRINVKTNIIEP